MTRKPEKHPVAGSDPSPPASPFHDQDPREGVDPIRQRSAPEREEIAAHHLMDEARLMGGLVARAAFTPDERARVSNLAAGLVRAARGNRHKHGGIDAFMHEYGLSSEEGVILMCLAEALLRIPDKDTADLLIAEKIGGGHWEKHLGRSESQFVNASTFGLMLTGRVVRLGRDKGSGPAAVLKRLVSRAGEPVIREALRRAMRVLGDSFVLGRTIEEALARAAPLEAKGYRFSFDMLGERARTRKDAERYFDRYMTAVEAVGNAHPDGAGPRPRDLPARPSISVKLSALHPRFDPGKEARLAGELKPRLVELASAARSRGVGLTVDAEEQDRLDLTLDLFAAAFGDPALKGWPGLGLAVQAYGKRAVPVLRWLRRLAAEAGKPIPVRLVKGAYWDSEIKWAQERGLDDYPVLTRKVHTDVSWFACMRLLLSEPAAFIPQFATHNALSIAAVSVAAPSPAAFEFQRLHGMGEALYEEVVGGDGRPGAACRIYAPVGPHEDLVAYLVRRLLENGANTSFVHRLADEEAPIARIIEDPVAAVEAERQSDMGPRRLPRPTEIFLPERRNSSGMALDQAPVRRSLAAEMDAALGAAFLAVPLIDGRAGTAAGAGEAALCPHDRRRRIGTVHAADGAQVERAIVGAARAVHAWDRLGGPARAAILDKAADLYERHRARLMAVMVREAGKTLENALADVREAVDFLRYYAAEARRLFSGPVALNGPTGETNSVEFRSRGPFACISPWNFPLAIFTGQVAAALAAGNPVLAKPAEQTPIVAFLAAQLLNEAGLPAGVLQLLPGDGAVGAALVRDTRVAGVAFTGSNATAWAIQKALAERQGAIVPFIAETGGLNAMIADSSALPEQAIRDVVRSAFDSAGQRCSAARLFFVQEDVAGPMLDMLVGAVEALEIGDPLDYATDIGPVIDEDAMDRLDAHKMRMQKAATELVDVPLPVECEVGTYVTPAVFEIADAGLLREEVFGPILHVVRFQGGHLDKVVAAINASGYGLTLGLHSRIAAVADYVAEHARVGNLYVNRNQIGAVVGVQPFGGEGLSGTGPKAGGPNYLARFATERVRTTDITATGGNVALLGLDEA
jgi:RHH-type transcriptional regulator, proline utilization regulon repressor / proline dehydrogenase / delta 1-pyrroline-5-carboxylate dehydrogenase